MPSFSSTAAGTLAFFVWLFFRLIFARGNEKGEGGREGEGGTHHTLSADKTAI